MTATVATLALVYGFPVEVEVVRRGVSTPASSGFVASRQLRSSVSRQGLRAQTRTWLVTFKGMGTAERAALLAAQASALGGVLPIAWTPPPPDDGASMPVRMPDKLTINYDGSSLSFFTDPVLLEEVI